MSHADISQIFTAADNDLAIKVAEKIVKAIGKEKPAIAALACYRVIQLSIALATNGVIK